LITVLTERKPKARSRRSNLRLRRAATMRRRVSCVRDAEAAGSHSPPVDRQARLPGAGRVNLRRRRTTVISTKKQPKTSYFDLFSAVFLYFFTKSAVFGWPHIRLLFRFYWIISYLFLNPFENPFSLPTAMQSLRFDRESGEPKPTA